MKFDDHYDALSLGEVLERNLEDIKREYPIRPLSLDSSSVIEEMQEYINTAMKKIGFWD